MYYTYENGKLVAKGDQYENPSSYTQYGTGETGANKGQANGWEQGVSNAGTGVLDGMGLGMFGQVGKMGYNGFKQMDNPAGDVMSQFFGPHHVMLGNVDDYKAGMIDKKDLGKVQAQNTLGWLLPGIGSIWGAIDQGKRRRDFANNANYVNNTNPFLFALDDKGLQFANPKAKAPAPVGDKTGWLAALGSAVGSGIKKGIDSKKSKNAVAPNTEADLNQDQPKNLAFMQNPLGDNPAIDNSNKESATRFGGGDNQGYNDQFNWSWKKQGFKKGGSVKVEGGEGNDDIALVDTNTGEDTGVRVEKDEMIVFSKKNVEALEKAISAGKKNEVFSIVKNQIKQHPEVKEWEAGFSGGGKLSKGAQLHLDNPNIRSEAYLRGAYESALKSGDSTDMADYNSMREAHEHILKMDSIKGQERRKEIDSLKNSPKIFDKIHGYGKDILGFSGGGYKDLSNDKLKSEYEAAKKKPIGKLSLDELKGYEKELKKRGLEFKAYNLLGPDGESPASDLIMAPYNLAKKVLVDLPMYLSEKANDYGDPIKDPKGYEKILQTKVDQLYEKKYGKMGVDLGGLKPTYDKKKWKELEAQVREQDLEKARKGENVNKVMPSDNEKPTYKDRNTKDVFDMLFPNADKAVQEAVAKKDGIPTVNLDPNNLNGGNKNSAKTPFSSTYKSTQSSSSTSNKTSTGAGVNIDDKSIAIKGVTQPDPSMLNVQDVAGKLQVPYAKTIDTAPETVNNSWLTDALGYAGDAGKLWMGMNAATKKIPEWTISDNWNEYMGKMKFMSNMGLSPEQKAQYLDTADRTYQYDLSNIYNLSNGNAGTVLGNIGRANANRYRSGVDLAIADKNAEMANNANYGNWLSADEQYRKRIFDENRNGLLMTKQAGMQLASDALANMDGRAEYNKFYGKGSQVEKLQNMQLEEQQTKNDILKAQKENYSNPDFWKNYSSSKTTGTDATGSGLFDAVKNASPEEIEALKKLWK
jgi:hypothetical protein